MIQVFYCYYFENDGPQLKKKKSTFTNLTIFRSKYRSHNITISMQIPYFSATALYLMSFMSFTLLITPSLIFCLSSSGFYCHLHQYRPCISYIHTSLHQSSSHISRCTSLRTLEARSCCWASICCCCLAAISCSSASVMSMRGVAIFKDK